MMGIFYLHAMRRVLLIISLIILYAPMESLAQDVDYRDTTGLDFPKYRNEVFLNMSTPFVIAMAGETLEPRWSIGYKRHLKPNMIGRIWFNYQELENIQEDKSDGRIVPTGAETFEYRLDDNFDFRADLRIGVSFHDPDERVTAIYGADVFFGLRERQLTESIIPYALDTSLCSNCYRPSLLLAPESKTSEETYFISGVDFSIGCLFKAGRRVWIVLQWTPEVSYSSLVDESFSDPDLRNDALTDGLNFNLRGIELFTGIRF